MIRVNPRVATNRELVEAYRRVAPATLGHLKLRGFMDPGIKPLNRGIRVVGPALTVSAPGMDIAALQKAYDLAEPGDVIVVERCGERIYACIGDTTALKAKLRGVAAVIVDGAITDSGEIEALGLPVWCRSSSAVVARNLGIDGEVNGIISCGGVVVRPGDLVIADDNGIAALTPAEAAELLEQALAQEERSSLRKAQLLEQAGGISPEQDRR